ncbi:MAG: hypothetical protein NUV75_09030 [Gallionella sp.]|nr:hypothetical protein [Gallionella sp.]
MHFLLLRKNASTSISAALQANGVRKRIPFEGECVAVWREPRDRLLATFRHYQRGLSIMEPGLDFEQFCSAQCGDWHLEPQWPVLRTCDRVLRFDRLNEDFEELRRYYPWIGELPRLNVSTP